MTEKKKYASATYLTSPQKQFIIALIEEHIKKQDNKNLLLIGVKDFSDKIIKKLID